MLSNDLSCHKFTWPHAVIDKIQTTREDPCAGGTAAVSLENPALVLIAPQPTDEGPC